MDINQKIKYLNAMISDPCTTTGEKENARSLIRKLKLKYPKTVQSKPKITIWISEDTFSVPFWKVKKYRRMLDRNTLIYNNTDTIEVKFKIHSKLIVSKFKVQYRSASRVNIMRISLYIKEQFNY